jgi:hypothetical protein
MSEKPNQPTKPVRQWYQKKRYKFSLIAVILFVILIASAPKSSNSSSDSSNKVADSSEKSTSPTPAPAKTDFVIGEKIENSGKQLTVTKIERNYSTGNQFSVPKAGKEFVRVYIELVNSSSSEISFSPFDFKVQDGDGLISSIDSTSYSLTDALSSNSLAIGGKVKGSVVFEVPKDDKTIVLTYSASFWTGEKIKVNLA